MPSPRVAPLIVAALAAAVLLPNLGAAPLWDEDEPLNVACSVAMRAGGDWIVPTFNGRLRVEKPALVNWLQLAGFTLAGVNETGARIGSAILTIGTCLLTWDIARRLFDPVVGAWAGVVMATCLWTGIAGRAATPDAPLAFLTTLALATFVRGVVHAGGLDHPVRLPTSAAIATGAAAGAAMLAKGPVGLVLPLAAFGLFAWWQALPQAAGAGPVRRWLDAGRRASRDARLGTIAVTALLVAAPWYVVVTLRTEGAWLRGFLLVHNVGRFAAPMEGHSGSPLFYYPCVLLVGMFPWSSGWIPALRHALQLGREPGPPACGTRLLAAWIIAWVIPFSIAGTKLPGYVWPAYPALACLCGHFIATWVRCPDVASERWMRAAWFWLGAAGVAIAAGLLWAAWRIVPGTAWIGVVGLVPLAGAAVAWMLHDRDARAGAAMTWAATAAITVAWLVAVAPAAAGLDSGPRHLVAGFAGASAPPLVLYRAPPSAVFYAARLAPLGRVPEASSPEALADLVARHDGAHVLLDARFEDAVRTHLPAGYRVIRDAAVPPSGRRVLLMGPSSHDPDSRLARCVPAPHRGSGQASLLSSTAVLHLSATPGPTVTP